MKKRILTGITTTGTPHIGNYIGAIRPAIKMTKDSDESFFFLADYHSIIKNQDSDSIKNSVKKALGSPESSETNLEEDSYA